MGDLSRMPETPHRAGNLRLEIYQFNSVFDGLSKGEYPISGVGDGFLVPKYRF